MDLTGIRSVDDLEVEEKAVFVRVDFNVPLDGKRITDDARIRAALPTIQALQERGAVVVLGSHMGRPKGTPTPALSLEPAAARLAELVDTDVIFADDCVGDAVQKVIRNAQPGDIVLLENLRFRPAEKANDPAFAKALAALADAYVNDAFGTSHRKHASTYGMVEYFDKDKIAMGKLVQQELEFLAPLLHQPQRPYVAIMGGAKVSDKIKVIENLIGRVDDLLIGGAMAYTFLAAQKIPIGSSLVESDKLDLATALINKAQGSNTRLHVPLDHGVASSFESTERRDTQGNAIADGDMGLDIGPRTVKLYQDVIAKAKTVIWNGPVGLFEREPFHTGTFAIANAMANNHDALTIVGGGDSAAAILAAGHVDSVSHVSTGGGASLTFLEGSDLPGISALRAGHRFTS